MLTTLPRSDRRRTADRRPVENDAYAEMLGRCIRVLGRRIADGNVEDVGLALRLRDELDAAIATGVRTLNEQGESWARIGRAAGITKQAAQQRWGTPPSGDTDG